MSGVAGGVDSAVVAGESLGVGEGVLGASSVFAEAAIVVDLVELRGGERVGVGSGGGDVCYLVSSIGGETRAEVELHVPHSYVTHLVRSLGVA